jgi:hypothetical protein
MPRRLAYPHHVTVRVNEKELTQLRGRARAAGLSVSRYLIESGLKSMPPLPAEEQAQRQRAIFHARKIGTNLNQIARQLNSQLPVAEEELAAALSAAREALERLTGGREFS